MQWGKNKSVTRGHGYTTSRHRRITRAWLHGLVECNLGLGKVITKLMISPIPERVMASYMYVQ